MHKFFQARRGFTLIELLLVIGIIAILASIVIVAINPTKQLGDARDSQRRSDVNTILSAVYQYAIDNNGNYPPDLQSITDTTAREICICNSTNCPDLAACSVSGPGTNELVNLLHLTGSYLLAIPGDPRFATDVTTNYTIRLTENNRIEVCSPQAEQTGGVAICVTR